MNDTGGTDYEDFALRYDAGAASSPWNRLLERPAVLAMVDDWSGLDVLEAGCAGGRLTSELIARGTNVTAFDRSPTLVGLAAQRNFAATVVVQDLERPFPAHWTAQFDVAVASLVMHYICDWVAPFRQFAAALRAGGRLIVSTGHPLADLRITESGDYFATELVHDTWERGYDPPLEVSFYRRPLAEMTRAFTAAGFAVTSIVETRAPASDAAAYGTSFNAARNLPSFIVFEATLPAG
jgi:SAM-dependent methyltransferase